MSTPSASEKYVKKYVAINNSGKKKNALSKKKKVDINIIDPRASTEMTNRSLLSIFKARFWNVLGTLFKNFIIDW